MWINEIVKEIKNNRRTIKELIKAKEFLDKYLIDVDDFTPLIPKIWEELKDTTLPISLFDFETYTLYCTSGDTGEFAHRWRKVPIIVYISSGHYYFYGNGYYDIDKDIENLRNRNVRLEARRKELNA